jgi:hypothetical protein
MKALNVLVVVVLAGLMAWLYGALTPGPAEAQGRILSGPNEHAGQTLRVGGVTSTGAVTATGLTVNGASTLKGATVLDGGVTATQTVTSQVASGSNAVSFTTNGARLDLGTGASDYLSSDGSGVTAAGQFNVTGIVVLNGAMSATAGSVTIDNNGGFRIATKSLPTCGDNTGGTVGEGTISMVAGAGAVYTKPCICSYNGTTRAWRHMISGTVGNTTTCTE